MARRSSSSGCGGLIIAIISLVFLVVLAQGLTLAARIAVRPELWIVLGGLAALITLVAAVHQYVIWSTEHAKACRARSQAKIILESAETSRRSLIVEAEKHAAKMLSEAESRAANTLMQAQQQTAELQRKTSVQTVEAGRGAAAVISQAHQQSVEIQRKASIQIAEAERQAAMIIAEAQRQSAELIRKASIQTTEAAREAKGIINNAKQEADTQSRSIAQRLAQVAAREADLRIRAMCLDQIDIMAGSEFEAYVARLLERNGYQIQEIGGSGDLGCDLIAELNGKRWAVQCKRQASPVSRRAVSDAVGAQSFYKCNAAMVITNNWFTSDARKMADKTACMLADRDQLGNWILASQGNETHGPALTEEYKTTKTLAEQLTKLTIDADPSTTQSGSVDEKELLKGVTPEICGPDLIPNRTGRELL